eukprot:5998782-Ditylum_brightwellii.AAC.1
MIWQTKRQSDEASKHHAADLLAHLKPPLPSLHSISALHRVVVGLIPTSGAKLFIAVTSRAT